jgi:hypothetical protein
MGDSNTNIGFLEKLLLSSNGVELVNSGQPVTKLLTDSFDTSLISLKVIFILLFIVMAFMNKYLKFIKENITAFSIETIIYGISGAIPFIFMETFRRLPGQNKNYMTMFIVMFLLYAFFNVVLEMGGLYAWLYEEDEISSKEAEVHHETTHQLLYHNMLNSIFITITLVLVYMILTMVFITYKVFDFNIEGYGNNNLMMFSLETLIFGLFNAVPFFLVAYNREKTHFNFNKNAIEVGLIFAKFVILHLLLQGSGFYKHSLGY